MKKNGQMERCITGKKLLLTKAEERLLELNQNLNPWTGWFKEKKCTK